jgi:hypothetical protein
MALVKVLEPILKYWWDIERYQPLLRTAIQHNLEGERQLETRCNIFNMRSRENDEYYHNGMLLYKIEIQIDSALLKH